MESDLFLTSRVRELQNEDFLLASVEGIVLKASGCSVILFYPNDTEESLNARDIWYDLSDQIAGVNFFAINSSRRIDIMTVFQRVYSDPNHPLADYGLATTPEFPLILVYREGGEAGVSWPKAFYNGSFNYDDIRAWIIRDACEPGYVELLEDNDFEQEVYEDDFYEDVEIDILRAKLDRAERKINCEDTFADDTGVIIGFEPRSIVSDPKPLEDPGFLLS